MRAKRKDALVFCTDSELSSLEKRVLDMNQRGMSQKETLRHLGGCISENPLRRLLHSLEDRGYKVTFNNVYRTDNHKRVADMTLAGKTSKEIAAELGLRLSTIKGLMTRARKEGLLPPLGPRQHPREAIWQKQAISLRQLGASKLNYNGRRYDDPAPQKCGK